MQNHAHCAGLTHALPYSRRSRGRHLTKTPSALVSGITGKHRTGSGSIILAMKLTALLLTFAILNVSARGVSQTVTLSCKETSLEKVLAVVKEQTGYVFFYNQTILAGTKPVTLDVNKLGLEPFLYRLFAEQPLTFLIENRNIILSRKLPLTNPVSGQLNAFIAITGTIIHSGTREALAGASVSVKGSSGTVISDNLGRFTIQANLEDILFVSYIGFQSIEVKASSANLGTVSMDPLPDNMKEVIINKGYYSTSRRLNTGSVSGITAADIEKQPVSNPVATLAGRVTGLIVTQTSGLPGASFDLQVRGQNSLSLPTAPLYVVDGVPFSSDPLTQRASAAFSPLNSINPADIESIEVLKDADATSIYGSRGANGVILITTKKGRYGKSGLDINVYTGAGKVTRTLDFLNTAQYVAMRKEAFNNDNVVPTNANAYDLLLWDTTRYTDWKKLLIGGTSHVTDANIRYSAGNQQTQFSLGAGYRRETTVFPGDMHDARASVQMNINHTSSDKKFTLLVSVNYSNDKNNLISQDLTQKIELAPNAPALYKPDGTLNWEEKGRSFVNPLSYLFSRYNLNTDNMISNVVMGYAVTRHLSLKLNAGYTTTRFKELSTFPKASQNPASSPQSSAFFGDNYNKGWIVEPQASYDLKAGPGNLKFLAGVTLQQTVNNITGITADNFTDDALIESPTAAATTYVTGSDEQYRYSSIFGRVSYDINNKYILNLTARRDGSSRFGPGKQFGDFGAAGAAWIFSGEHFFKNHLRALSFGKLRASYGSAGSDAIGNYQYLDSWSPSYGSYQSQPGLSPDKLFNPDYRWEINRKLEGALELGFLKDRIMLTTAYFYNRSGNQLAFTTQPGQTGFTYLRQNLDAVIQNSGLEVELKTINIKSAVLKWNSSFNITVLRNKLVAFPNLESSAFYSYVIGKSLSLKTGYRYLGVDPKTGVYQFEDIDKSNAVSYPNDYVEIGNTDPRFYGGFQNNISYRGWQLDFTFRFVKQEGNAFRALGNYRGSVGSNQPSFVLNRWQKPGDETSIQQFTTGTKTTAAYTAARKINSSSAVLTDASFARLQNLSVSYSLPASWMKELKGMSCRIYVQGQNLFTITKYKGADPEYYNYLKLPPLKVLTAGVQMSF